MLFLWWMEKRIERLKQELLKLSIETKKTEDTDWLSFMQDGLKFRCTVDEKMDFMTIGIGFYQEHGGVERDKILDLINRMNHRINYAKVIEVEDFFWITYELDVEKRMPDKGEIEKMIQLLIRDYCLLVSAYNESIGFVQQGDELEQTPGAFDWNGYLNNGTKQL